MNYAKQQIDWSRRGDYIRAKHGVDPAWADEAVSDPTAFWLDPDPASRSGLSVRVIGYSEAAHHVMVVILLPAVPTRMTRRTATGGALTRGPQTAATNEPTGRGSHMSKIDDLLAAEGDAAERTPTPDNVTGEHRNWNRSVMFSLRLNPDELDELQRRADERGLPVRTLARAWLLQAMRTADSLEARVDRLEQTVFKQSA